MQICFDLVSAQDYIAIVRIEMNAQVLDVHLPQFSDRWTTGREAQRGALEYAVKLIDRRRRLCKPKEKAYQTQ
jgi:hypothetical protein